ncbi:DUF732 domain-containing protein [Mycolicibacter heraklionensis]|uniref:DUF732 domain-containing protein n=1 Tax=Mycolicibacter heraklionensis TaxID=512402 RepID=A0A9X7WLB1_9MYCO|nr:DUF732 domain-containing protein [Mycolicibacter heraklionensis]QZA09624.1 DUF732 domain-containing protein [Mycolicibacter heraklionensis]
MTVSTTGTAMGRIAKALSAGVAVMGLLFGAAGMAQADEQSYMDYLFAHGFTYHRGADAAPVTIEWGHWVCDKIHRAGNPRDGLILLDNLPLTDVMIEGAQHELCPDTLGGSDPAPVSEPS